VVVQVKNRLELSAQPSKRAGLNAAGSNPIRRIAIVEPKMAAAMARNPVRLVRWFMD
jgi:hypothetical protein